MNYNAAMIKRFFVSCFALIVASVLSAPALAAKEPLRLSPVSQWQVNYSDDSCRMARQFGEGDTESFVMFERYRPGDPFQLIIFGKPFNKVRNGGEAKVAFGPTESEQSLGYYFGEMSGLPALVFTPSVRLAAETEAELAEYKKWIKTDRLVDFTFEPIDTSREVAVEFISVDAPSGREVILETGSLGKPFAAFRQCIDELLLHWGVDVEAHRSLTREATPATSPSKWITNADYPSSMIRSSNQGIVHVRLDVAENGSATGCHIQSATDPEGFSDVVCRLLIRRARFEPALDARGNPISSYYVTSVRFHLD